MQLHDILQLRTSVILPEAISDGGLAPTTDTSLFLTTYRGGSHLPSDINNANVLFVNLHALDFLFFVQIKRRYSIN
jgi:hypothetical protein